MNGGGAVVFECIFFPSKYTFRANFSKFKAQTRVFFLGRNQNRSLLIFIFAIFFRVFLVLFSA